MSIVLKENEWAHDMIEKNELGNKPSETLKRVAGYYLSEGYSPTEARMQLEDFLIRCDPDASIPKWSNLLDYAINHASKFKPIDIESIEITDTELKKINELDGKQIKRLAFTLLCLAKYRKSVFGGEDYWVNNKDNEIMAMANINTSIKRQGLMYWTLREAGMIQFSKRIDNTSVKVCFVDDGEAVLHITDFRNLGYQYLKYCGEPYFECVNCGLVTKYNHPNKTGGQKYCNDCAIKVCIQQRLEAMSRYKKSHKS